MTTPYAATSETHTGVVYLLGDRAFKLKKPVDFGFCDFTTRAARAAACAREVELNARLSPDVYLGVGELNLPGTPAEPLVVMRRMPADRRLAHLVETGLAVDDDIRALARLLASFHERCHHGPRVAAEASRDALRGRWEANLRETRRYRGPILDGSDLTAIEHDVVEFLAGREPLLSERIADDRIVDGHGDLLADDIFCLPDRPRILDCLEFDDRLRYVDRIDDVAFLAMDLERLGAPALAARLLEWYREFSDDRAPPALVHHYIAYRAFVRAKVACIRDGQGDPEAGHQAHLLTGITRRHLDAGAVRLILVGGLPGTGKSTLAGRVGDELGCVVLSSDRIRKELAGVIPEQPAAAQYRQGLYSTHHTARVYAELCARASALLARGESVILDASWSSRAARTAAAEVAERTHSRLVSLRCEAPAASAAARMIGRRGPSDADPAIAAAMRVDADPWPEAEVVDTGGALAEAIAAAVAHVHPRDDVRPWPSRRTPAPARLPGP
jgi:aminoglycoside phosphotransferase family enzyme/predicted kinase